MLNKWNPHSLLMETQLLWKTAWQFIKWLNIELLYDPAILLLGIYPRGTKSCVHARTCTQMFIAALFIIAKNRNNSNTNWWMAKWNMIYPYNTMFLAIESANTCYNVDESWKHAQWKGRGLKNVLRFFHLSSVLLAEGSMLAEEAGNCQGQISDQFLQSVGCWRVLKACLWEIVEEPLQPRREDVKEMW